MGRGVGTGPFASTQNAPPAGTALGYFKQDVSQRLFRIHPLKLPSILKTRVLHSDSVHFFWAVVFAPGFSETRSKFST